jgi:hypothetical protein
MTPGHQYFEILCALSVSGQISGVELAELNGHLAHCRGCREQILELAEASSQLILVRKLEYGHCRIPDGLRQRFVARAIGEGIPLKQFRPARAQIVGLRLAALLVFAALLTVSWRAGHRRLSVDKEQSWQMAMAEGAAREQRGASSVQTAVPVHRPHGAYPVSGGEIARGGKTGKSRQIDEASTSLVEPRGFRQARVTFDLFASTPVMQDEPVIAGIGPLDIPSVLDRPGAFRGSLREPGDEPWAVKYLRAASQQSFHYEASLAETDLPRFSPGHLNFKANPQGMRFLSTTQ